MIHQDADTHDDLPLPDPEPAGWWECEECGRRYEDTLSGLCYCGGALLWFEPLEEQPC